MRYKYCPSLFLLNLHYKITPDSEPLAVRFLSIQVHVLRQLYLCELAMGRNNGAPLRQKEGRLIKYN